MKKVFYLVMVICLVFSLVGCSDIENEKISKINNIDLSSPIVTETIRTFMKDNNITKLAKDIEYDYANNLETKFGITGTATLDNYYNWAYDSSMEKDFFCLRVDPTEESGTETWYLYLNRFEGEKIFEAFKEKDMRIFAVCIIPESKYEEGQKNMASVKYIKCVDW